MDSAILNFWQLIAIFICAAQLSSVPFNADPADNATIKASYLSVAVEEQSSLQVWGKGNDFMVNPISK